MVPLTPLSVGVVDDVTSSSTAASSRTRTPPTGTGAPVSAVRVTAWRVSVATALGSLSTYTGCGETSSVSAGISSRDPVAAHGSPPATTTHGQSPALS